MLKGKDLKDFMESYDWRCAFNEGFGFGYLGFDSFDDGSANGTHVDDEIVPVCGVEVVYAHDEGINDEENWICIFKYENGKYGFLSAGCDYTGWDCRAGGSIEWHDTLNSACSKMSLGEESRRRLGDHLRELENEGVLRLDWNEEGSYAGITEDDVPMQMSNIVIVNSDSYGKISKRKFQFSSFVVIDGVVIKNRIGMNGTKIESVHQEEDDNEIRIVLKKSKS